ncbi:MAG: glycosyltransferase [Devosia sp.]
MSSVFLDPSGRRKRFFDWLTGGLTVLLVVAAIAFVAVLSTSHGMVGNGATAALFAETKEYVAAPITAAQHAHRVAQQAANELSEPSRTLSEKAIGARASSAAGSMPAELAAPDGRPLSIGFYVNWDDNSYPALQRSLPHLDWVIPAWMSLHGDGMALTTDIDTRALDLMMQTRPTMPILPLIQNTVDDNWDGEGLAKLLANPTLWAQRLSEITAFLLVHKFAGLTVDFEEVPSAAQPDLKAFLLQMSAAFKPLHLSIALAVPYDDNDWDYKAYAAIADYTILMAYDQHWATSSPGSIAAQDWFENTLDKRMAELDPARTIVAIGGYGYDWVKGQTATDLTFQEAVRSAQDSEAQIDFDDSSNNPHFSYVEDDGKTHNVWFLDGVTAYNEIHAADVYRPAGYAVWRLGSEDPSLWSVMGRPYGATAPEGIKTIGVADDVDFEGRGELLRVVSHPAAGARDVDLDAATGDIDDETYVKLPTSYVVDAFGAKPGKIALTFDDGPDPVWTPQVLSILKQKSAVGTFFMIGENAAANPDLVRQVVDGGNEIGNHTYTHPNIAELPAGIAKLEINATQRAIEAITGRSTRLFRPPFLGDSEPTTRAEVEPIDLAQSMGYITVGLKVDPDDWMRPDADTIVQRVLDGATSTDPESHGNIVLLHDAGGDRAQTVLALPKLIDALRAKGFELVTVSDLAGLTRDEAMPPTHTTSLASLVDVPMFMVLRTAGGMLGTLFQWAIWLGLARLVFLIGLGGINMRQDRRRKAPVPAVRPLVSVLIPAHNEERVIVTSIVRILASEYAPLEIVVIDDGSTDATSVVVRQAFADNALVRFLSISNGGKANALNRGLEIARGSIVVALDADTQFEPQTIARLSRWFEDDDVGAVAGNAKVGNRINLVTRWQALEYITAQNLERRALAAAGAVTVVPGAVGAWRRTVLDALGGYPADTLAEDQDLTIAVGRAGWKIVFDSEAVAWTEAPDTLRGLAKQRFRWAFGTLQCLWKHRSAIGNPNSGALGMFALPQVALFQVVLSLLSPLVDLLFVWQLIWTGLDYLQHQSQFDPASLLQLAMFYGVFLLVDVTTAAAAFLFERREDPRLLWWLPLQRFGYRQLMYYVVAKSLVKAITGQVVGWGTLERTATVDAGVSKVL